MVVPGSGLVKIQAENEGLHTILTNAGFDWREPGCSMCLAMNPDKLEPGERCASTSNRNFEGRQGNGGRTHLVSPAMAAAAAVSGYLTDVRNMEMSALPEPTDKTFLDMIRAMDKTPIATNNPSRPAAAASAAASGGRGSTPPSTTTDPSKQLISVYGRAAALPIQNIDTDMIIPKQFLKTTKRSGLGQSAFYEMRYVSAHSHPLLSLSLVMPQPSPLMALPDNGSNRYNTDGSERDDFVLNQEKFREACIIVAGDNFGCGSSREHAPWAIADFGIRCIVSTSFADIFFNNSFKNGLLPIVLNELDIARLFDEVKAFPDYKLRIDLAEQRVITPEGRELPFTIDASRKHSLLNGLDEIGLTLQKADMIRQYEAERLARHPWLVGQP